MSSPPPQIVEVLSSGSGVTGWQPAIGEETVALVDHFSRNVGIPSDGLERLQHESVGILRRCIDPHGGRPAVTGLVVGYVQSGKTMSFTTVSALAKDNGYPLVVVITGTSVNLFEQSRDRLLRDLRLTARRDRKWQHFSNPAMSHRDRIDRILDDWRDPETPPLERQTILITVMKNYTRLGNLIEVLGELHLAGAPALIIDDEADQGGLNTLVRKNDESTTYSQLLSLKRVS